MMVQLGRRRSARGTVVVIAVALVLGLAAWAQAADDLGPSKLQQLQGDVDLLMLLNRLEPTPRQVEQLIEIIGDFHAREKVLREEIDGAIAPSAELLKAIRDRLIKGERPEPEAMERFREAQRAMGEVFRRGPETRMDAVRRIIEVFGPEQVQRVMDPMPGGPGFPGEPGGPEGPGEGPGALLGRVRQLSDVEFDARKEDIAKGLLGEAAFDEGGERRIAVVIEVLTQVRSMTDDQLRGSQRELLAKLGEAGVERAQRRGGRPERERAADRPGGRQGRAPEGPPGPRPDRPGMGPMGPMGPMPPGMGPMGPGVGPGGPLGHLADQLLSPGDHITELLKEYRKGIQ